MTEMTEPRHCLTCRFADVHSEDVGGEDVIGVCRRYPPTACWDPDEGFVYAGLPPIEMFDWCGEYQERA